MYAHQSDFFVIIEVGLAHARMLYVDVVYIMLCVALVYEICVRLYYCRFSFKVIRERCLLLYFTM